MSRKDFNALLMVLILAEIMLLVHILIWRGHTPEPVVPEVETDVVTVQHIPEKTYYPVPLEEDLQDLIVWECDRHGIDPAIVMAMIDRESDFRPWVVGDGGDSFGLMQIQPKWHKARMEKLGATDLLNPYQNVSVGIDYLAELLDRYGDMGKALTAYNQGKYKGVVSNYAKGVMETSEQIKEAMAIASFEPI